MTSLRIPPDAYARAADAAAALAERTDVERHDVVVVLGSGWRTAAEQLGTPSTAFPAAELRQEPHVGALPAGRIDEQERRIHADELVDLLDVIAERAVQRVRLDRSR